MLHDLLDKFAERVVGMQLVKVQNELGDDFGVGVALEAMALVLQEHLDLFVVGYYAVVHDHEGMAGVRSLGMGVGLARHSVSGPASVSDAAMDVDLLVHVQVFALWNLSEPLNLGAVVRMKLADSTQLCFMRSASGPYLRLSISFLSKLTFPVFLMIVMSLACGASMATPEMRIEFFAIDCIEESIHLFS